jgi:hypothetical protein
MKPDSQKILNSVRDTLEDSIMILAMPYTKLKRLERMGIKTIRDFRDFEFAEDEDKGTLNRQKHFQEVFWERDWNNEE